VSFINVGLAPGEALGWALTVVKINMAFKLALLVYGRPKRAKISPGLERVSRLGGY
jgi:hypothetical protein